LVEDAWYYTTPEGVYQAYQVSAMDHAESRKSRQTWQAAILQALIKQKIKAIQGWMI